MRAEVVARGMVLGMQLQQLLVGLDAPAGRFRTGPVGNSPRCNTARASSGGRQAPARAWRWRRACPADLRLPVDHRELGVCHREIRIELERLFEQRDGLHRQSALVKVDPFRVMAIRLDRRGRDVREPAIERLSVSAPPGRSQQCAAGRDPPRVAIVDLKRRVSSSTSANRLASPAPSTRSALTMRPVRASWSRALMRIVPPALT